MTAYSAGSHPTSQVNPFVLELLRKNRIDVANARSKSWDEFAAPGAPKLDFVFTVCDQAAGEVCPVWPGQPMTAHWGVADPAAEQGDDAARRRAFFRAYNELTARIALFLNLPMEKLDRLTLQKKLDDASQQLSRGLSGRAADVDRARKELDRLTELSEPARGYPWDFGGVGGRPERVLRSP